MASLRAADLQAISSNPLFAAIGRDELDRSLARLPWRIGEFDKGQIVRTQGSPCDEMLLILEGTIAANFITYDGRLMRVETLSAPQIIASAFLFAPTRRFPVEVEAQTDLRLFMLARNLLLDLCSEHRPALEHLLADLARRTSFLANKLKMVQFETLRERLAHYLLGELAVIGGTTVTLTVSKKELSEIMGVARQSLFRTLTELEEEGVIACTGREVRVLDTDALKLLAAS